MPEIHLRNRAPSAASLRIDATQKVIKQAHLPGCQQRQPDGYVKLPQAAVGVYGCRVVKVSSAGARPWGTVTARSGWSSSQFSDSVLYAQGLKSETRALNYAIKSWASVRSTSKVAASCSNRCFVCISSLVVTSFLVDIRFAFPASVNRLRTSRSSCASAGRSRNALRRLLLRGLKPLEPFGFRRPASFLCPKALRSPLGKP